MVETRLERIVAATDFSEDAANALLRAALLAREHGAELELLHVVPQPALEALRSRLRTSVDVVDRLMTDVRQSLADTAASTAGRTRATLRVEAKAGNVLSEILLSCQRADMLALGARGNNSLRDAFIGTTAERLLGKCAKPILVVKRPPHEPYMRVLVPLDFNPISKQALRTAMRVAPKAMIIAVHAYELPFGSRLRLAGVSDHDIEDYLARYSESVSTDIKALWDDVGAKERRFSYAVELGTAAQVIRDQEYAFAADLIVIGKHERAGGSPFELGSVTRRVLAESACDVLVLQEFVGASETKP